MSEVCFSAIAAQAPTTQSENMNPMTNQQARILVVDDNLANLGMFVDVLTDANYRVATSRTGESALKKLERNTPDLILLDVMLPGLNGFEVCQQLKTNPKTQAIPIIFMTALTDTSDKLKGLTIGAVDYITKPFNQEEVLARVRLHLQLHQVTQTLDVQNKQLHQLTQNLEQQIQKRTLALRESKEYLLQLTENITSVFWLTNLDRTKILYISSACEQIFGYSQADFHHSPDLWLQVVHPEDRPHVTAAFSNQAQENYEHDYRIIRSDGVVRWVHDHTFPIRDHTGQIHRIAGIAEDITEKRQTEETLRLQERAIAASGNGMVIIDAQKPNYPINFVNRAFETMTSHNAAEIIGQNYWIFQEKDEEQLGFEVLRRALEEQQSCTVSLRRHHKDGRYYWIDLSVAPIYDRQGHLTHYIVIQTDITDRKQAEVTLQKANEELARATRLKADFLGTMSHELRTPLSAILSTTEVLREGIYGQLSNDQIQALQAIEFSSSHLLKLINDILDLSKIESGHLKLDRTLTAVAPLCQSSLALIQHQVQQKQIRWEAKLPPCLPHIFVDERRIRQVLLNLLNNAIKFTPEGGCVTLEVSLIQGSGTNDVLQNVLRIAVIDTGIGIAPDDINQLFQPFFQTDSTLSRNYEGAGLGLALVKRIVDLHGGSTGVTSEVGVGSCFTIDLPCVASELSSATAEIDIDPSQCAPDIAPTVAPDFDYNPSEFSQDLHS